MNRVVHFEIPAEDQSRAKDFYGSVFGWGLMTMPMGESEYTMVTTTPTDETTMTPTEPGSINGGIMDRSTTATSPIVYVDVDDIDAVLVEVEANGGSTVTPKTPIPGMGAFAHFRDSEGNTLGVFSSD